MSERISTDANLIKAMEVFVTVIETGQITAAAKLMGMTQSAASQQIATLERLYEARLLDRSSRPVRATRAGLLLQRHAVRLLNAAADLSTEMRHAGPRPISVLRVGVLASIATTVTPVLVELAQSDFGVEELTLHAGQSGDHEALLRAKKADIAITSNPFYDMEGLERHAVFRESFLLVTPQGTPTMHLSKLFERLPLIRFADSTDVGRRVRQHLRRLRLQPGKVIQADRSSMVTACVAKGMGFTMLTPTLLIDGLVEQMSLDITPLESPGFSRAITVVAREGELGELPTAFATSSQAALRDQISQQMGEVGLAAIE